MGTNERRLDMLEKRVRALVSESAERDARRIVAVWNGRRAKGRELWLHLRIGAAIRRRPSVADVRLSRLPADRRD